MQESGPLSAIQNLVQIPTRLPTPATEIPSVQLVSFSQSVWSTNPSLGKVGGVSEAQKSAEDTLQMRCLAEETLRRSLCISRVHALLSLRRHFVRTKQSDGTNTKQKQPIHERPGHTSKRVMPILPHLIE